MVPNSLSGLLIVDGAFTVVLASFFFGISSLVFHSIRPPWSSESHWNSNRLTNSKQTTPQNTLNDGSPGLLLLRWGEIHDQGRLRGPDQLLLPLRELQTGPRSEWLLPQLNSDPSNYTQWSVHAVVLSRPHPTHKAPLYQVCYVRPEDHEFTEGKELVKAFNKTGGNCTRHFCTWV